MITCNHTNIINWSYLVIIMYPDTTVYFPKTWSSSSTEKQVFLLKEKKCFCSTAHSFFQPEENMQSTTRLTARGQKGTKKSLPTKADQDICPLKPLKYSPLKTFSHKITLKCMGHLLDCYRHLEITNRGGHRSADHFYKINGCFSVRCCCQFPGY